MSRQAFYNHPRYYEIAFNVNRKAECDFLEGAFAEHSRRPVRRLLDIACGTGQHLIRMAERGYEVAGLDLSRENITYIRERAGAKGLTPELIAGNMIDFRVSKPFDAAICMQDSQGHLLTNEEIVSHFRAVARALRPGGLYIFDRMILDRWSGPTSRYRWTKRQGKVTVTTTFRTLLDVNQVRQICREEMTFEVTKDGKRHVIRQHHMTRVVFPQELRALIDLAGEFELAAWYPNFDLSRRLDQAKRPTMIVAVLRRR